RERDLPARDLFSLAKSCSQMALGFGARLLINDRADIAASVGAGVHLTTRSMTADIIRRVFGPDMLIGASTHSIDEAERAEREGADFVVFGPVFETESKQIYGPPVGLAPLEAVAVSLCIPVLALGGINISNYRKALDSGAGGIAGISLFTQASDLKNLVRDIKQS